MCAPDGTVHASIPFPRVAGPDLPGTVGLGRAMLRTTLWEAAGAAGAVLQTVPDCRRQRPPDPALGGRRIPGRGPRRTDHAHPDGHRRAGLSPEGMEIDQWMELAHAVF